MEERRWEIVGERPRPERGSEWRRLECAVERAGNGGRGGRGCGSERVEMVWSWMRRRGKRERDWEAGSIWRTKGWENWRWIWYRYGFEMLRRAGRESNYVCSWLSRGCEESQCSGFTLLASGPVLVHCEPQGCGAQSGSPRWETVMLHIRTFLKVSKMSHQEREILV